MLNVKYTHIVVNRYCRATYKILRPMISCKQMRVFFSPSSALHSDFNFLNNQGQWQTLRKMWTSQANSTKLLANHQLAYWHFFRPWTFFFPSPHLWAILWSLLLFIKCLLFILRQNFSRCLAVTDLCVGLVVQPVYAAEIVCRIMNINMNISLTKSLRTASAWSLCGVSSLTSTGIGADRLLALLLVLRYRHVVTLRRVRVVIICFWLIGASCGAIWVRREDTSFKVTSIFVSLGLFIAIFCYTRIHIKLRYYKTRVQDNVLQGLGQTNGRKIPVNIARYKKSVSSVLWVQLALVACYAPWGIAVVLYVNGIENDVVWLVTETLVYLNSSLNPILICWTIRVVRRAVKDIIRQSNCS